MFKRDSAHQGVAEGVGHIDARGLCQRWSRELTAQNRGSSGPLIARIDGVPTVLLAHEGACDNNGCSVDPPGSVVALDGASGTPLWAERLPPDATADPYGPLLADIDADGRRELVVPSLRDNRMFAVRTEVEDGQPPGSIQWTFEYEAGGSSEAAPAAANFDPSDDALEIVLGTSFDPDPGRIYLVSGLDGTPRGEPLQVARRSDLDPGCDPDPAAANNKADSSSPAVALVGGIPTAFVGAWDGHLYALQWSAVAGGLEMVATHAVPTFDTVECSIGKIRNGPVVFDDAQGVARVAFGYMPELGGDAQFEMARLRVVTADGLGEGSDLPIPIWKSSPSVAPAGTVGGHPRVVAGRFRGVFAASVEASGPVEAWNVDRGDGGAFGANRSSPAIADIDDDGTLEAIVGIEGDDGPGVVAVSLDDGAIEWTFSAGSVAGGPAIGDIDDDDELEVVFFDLSGRLYALDNACP